MNFSLIIFLLVLHINCIENDNRTGKVFGGRDAKIEEIPFIVRLIVRVPKLVGTCSGSYIHKNWVLTAEHCVNVKGIKPSNITCCMGSEEASELWCEQERKAKSFIYPKKAKHYQDIAMIELEKPFNLTDNVAIGRLPPPHKPVDFKRDISGVCTVAGWGLTKKHSGASEDLQIGEVRIKPHCTKKHNWCSDPQAAMMAPCHGDSGGPLVCKNTIIGIISRGIPKCGPNGRDYYTKVHDYLDFIYGTMNHAIPIPINSYLTILLIYLNLVMSD